MKNFITGELSRCLDKMRLPFTEISKQCITDMYRDILRDLRSPNAKFVICGMGAIDNSHEEGILEYVKVSKVGISFETMTWDNIIDATGKKISWRYGPNILLQVD